MPKRAEDDHSSEKKRSVRSCSLEILSGRLHQTECKMHEQSAELLISSEESSSRDPRHP